MDGTDREPTIEQRLDQLEARIARLEAGPLAVRSIGAVSAAAAHPVVPVPPPAQSTGWVVPPAAPRPVTPPPATATGWVVPERAARPAAPARPTTWASVPEAGPSIDLRAVLADLEERMTGRMLVWVGGIALVLAAILFLGLAFSQGWIGPELRVLMGLVAGAAGIAVGAFFMERGDRLLGHVLTPVGLAVVSISLVAATRLYGLIPVPLGLGVALVAAIATAAIAVRANSQVVAAFGLVAVLIAPPLLGAAPDLTTLAFVGVALIGTTSIALWRSWPWLPLLAFVLTAPQMASWLSGETNVAFGLIGLASFSAIQTVAAGGEEFRRRRDDLSASSASLLIASSAFLVWGGFQLLDGSLVAYRATFLVVVALAYLALGAAFLVRDGDRHLFGLLTMATGLAALTMAAPIGLGAPAVPVAWTAEAVVLAWVAIRRPHPYSALVSGLLYILTAAWLVAVVFVPGGLPAASIPFAHSGGVALATALVGIALGVAIVPILSARQALAALGLATAAWCAVLELSGALVVDTQIWFAVVGAALIVGLPLLGTRTVDWRPDGLIARAWPALGELGPLTPSFVPAVALASGAYATWHLVAVELYADWVAPTSGIPFVSTTGLTLVVYLLGLLAIGWLIRSWALRQSLTALGLLAVAVACSDELWGVALVATWSALMVLGLGLWRLMAAASGPVAAGRSSSATSAASAATGWTADQVAAEAPRVAREAPRVAALLVGAAAAVLTVRTALPLESFGAATLPAVPFADQGTAMAVILAVAAVLAGLVVGGPGARRIGILAAGVAVAYLIPFEVEPWAVVVLWSILAVAAFVATRLEPDGAFLYEPAGGAMLAIAALAAVGWVAPPTRLVVSADGLSQLAALETLIALAALGVAGAIGAVLLRAERWARWLEVAVGVEVVYLVSIAVVDIFATQVGGATALDELRWQSQAALSVAWAILGMIAFVAGLRLERAELRIGGLVLLGLTTVKVFAIDLAALDVAYKVLALFGLGLVLVVSGGLWQRLHVRPPRAPQGPAAVHR